MTKPATSATYREPELTGPVLLCDGRGRLNPGAIGWSRRPLHTCNLRRRWPRKKRWNYWCVTGERFLFSITMADIDYAGAVFAYFLEFETQRYATLGVTLPLGRGVNLPPTVDAAVAFESPMLRVAFTPQPAADGAIVTRIQADSPSFGGERLAADLLVRRPADHETLNVVIPWSDTLFQFTSKQNTLPATGEVALGSDTYHCGEGAAFGCLDYGRGIWPYRTNWNWGAASGTQGGRTIGLNLGGQWTDGTGMNENGVCVDGRLSKISEDLDFGYDRSDYMKPWSVRTRASDRVDLRLEPFFERRDRTNLLVARTDVHQLFGRYSGRVTTDEGERIELDGLVGWVEQQQARW